MGAKKCPGGWGSALRDIGKGVFFYFNMECLEHLQCKVGKEYPQGTESDKQYY